MFAFYLNRKSASLGSELMFGGYNKYLIQEELVWHQVVSESFWIINCQKIEIGNEDS